LEST